MSKGLEALERTIERLQNGEKIIVRDYLAIEKELKAFEIIKNKDLNLDELLEEIRNGHDYNDYLICYDDEFDMLSEGVASIYCIHISDLEIFDKPKELSEFSVRCPKADVKFDGVKGKMLAYKQLTKAPQNFVYIEV